MALDLLSWSSLFNVSDDRVQRNILNFLNHTRILKINESFLKHLNLTKHFLPSMFLRLLEKNCKKPTLRKAPAVEIAAKIVK